MLASFDKLNRMLSQEKRLGYKNKAVLGGLEKLAPNWKAEARQETTSEILLAVIDEVEQFLLNYPGVAEQERPAYLHQILVKLYKVEQLAQTTPKSPEQQNPQPLSDSKIAVWEDSPKKEPAQPQRPEPVSPPAPPPQPKYQPRAVASSAAAEPSYENFTDTGLNSPVTKLPGIKEVMAKKLAHLGVQMVGDFLRLYPRRYDDYRSLKTINRLEYGEEVTIIAQVWETRKREIHNRQTVVTTTLSDGTGTIEVSWFNQPWLANKLTPGTQIVVSGKVDQYLGRLTFPSPEWEELDTELMHTGRMVPVYPLTEGITAKWLRKQVKPTVDYWSSRLPDYLLPEAGERLKLLSLSEAIRQIHFPDDWHSLEAARRRLAFDELLLIQLGVLRQRQTWRAQKGSPVTISSERLEQILHALPFQLTQAQGKALHKIVEDLQIDVPMSRLLQGDVGSGKTVVALVAMVLTALDGGQTTMLAPTEILAEQHFKSLSQLLEPIQAALGRPFNIQLLTGSTSTAARRTLLEQLAAGEVDLLVGTHAIIQGDVEIKNLRLAVVDEQHRFGVGQRGALRDKGFNPHLLVMTATPIPRTLALTLYGDLDLSIIDELPPGRQTIQTRWLTPQERERAYSFIKAQIETGRQGFVICPLVEESEKTEARSAIEEHKRLQTKIFPKLKLGLLHGRMKADEKEKVMTTFREGETQILVSTSVVEVGIDIPNASVILIEGANRFGLAQLHQFRGRVGRGQHKSYCLLLADKVSAEVEQRLQAVEQTSDGFQLAEKDLELRGPGEFFGTRQSGLPDLKLVKLSDTRLLELARQEAELIFKQDPRLEQPEHRLLVRQLEQFWSSGSDLS